MMVMVVVMKLVLTCSTAQVDQTRWLTGVNLLTSSLTSLTSSCSKQGDPPCKVDYPPTCVGLS